MQTFDDAQIADAAYHLWLAEGRPAGQDMDHWLRARANLKAAIAAPKKRRATAKPKTDVVTPKAKKAAAKPRKARVS